MAISHYMDEKSTEDSNDFLFRLAHLHLSRIKDSLYASRIRDLLGSRDIRGLCDLEPTYAGLSALDAYEVRQITAFFQKRADLDLGIDQEAVAWEKFKEAEALCRETNTLMRAARQGRFVFSPDFSSVLFTARRKIARVLGDVLRLSDLRPRFGPGASTQVQKRTASWKRKLSQAPACSEDLLPLARVLLEEMQGWFFSGSDVAGEPDSVTVTLEIHPGRLSFVPKSYKTHRSIVVEPQLNSMFQLAIGDIIARKLRRVGIDTRDQTRNKSLAALGSLTGDLATLDLSSASDTIALELIAELLPVDWFSFLRYFRTSLVVYGGEEFRLEKFSSMGNGFTFPLETLVFWALVRATVDLHPEGGESATVSCYGDDIIVPSACAEAVSSTLRLSGFVVNTSKSYSEGPFRESCGGDYLSGTDIRPFYQRGPLSGQSLFVLHNFYVRRFDEEAAALVLELIPDVVRLWGPDGYGDGHLITRCPELKPHGRSRGWGGYTFETYTLRPKKDFDVLPGDRVFPLYSTYMRELGEDSLSAQAAGLLPPSGPQVLLQPLPDGWGIRELPVHKTGRAGQPIADLPGASKVNRIKVYVLSN